MIKVAANQMDYQAATALYTRSLGLHQDRARQALTFAARKRALIEGDRPWISSNRSRSPPPACARRPGACASSPRTSPTPNSTPPRPGADPYRRKIPTFQLRDRPRARRATVALGKARTDPSDFRLKYEPGHPAADANGNVKYPNVNPLIEMTDMREAQRSYEANINVISATRRMIQRTIDILKA